MANAPLRDISAITTASLRLKRQYAALTQLAENSQGNRLRAFGFAAFLVAVPVFIQAPLVRVAPTLSLMMTGIWLGLGYRWMNDTDAHHPNRALWGDLIVGFSWTWLAGSVYWGWFRTNPYIHLPIESLALPVVLALMFYGKTTRSSHNTQIGNYFYLGSLIGTAITDLYFYCVGLIPYWQALMVNPPDRAGTILHSALLKMGTYEGVGYAIVLLALLIMLGSIPVRSKSIQWWAFSGAILSTILVDSLFFIAAILS
ncbi:MAG: DUF3120 domain-containing protein [Cyanobacteria bacterium P01_D01_bin.105]